MTHEQSITAILKSSAHQETQNTHDEMSTTMTTIKSTHNGNTVDWDAFESSQVKKLDAKSHESHVKAVHKIVAKGKSLPPNEQQSFMEKAGHALQAFGSFMSGLFSKLSSIVVDALSAVKDLVGDIISIIGEVFDKLVELIDGVISKITDWAHDAANTIEEWNPFTPVYFNA